MAQPGATVQANGFTYTVSPGQFDPTKSCIPVNGKMVNVERESICHIGDRSTAGPAAPVAPAAPAGATVQANGFTYTVSPGQFDPTKSCIPVNGKMVNVERESICHIGDRSTAGPAAPAAPAAPAGATVQANGFTYTVSPGQFDPEKSAMLVGGKMVNVERESICHIGNRSTTGPYPASPAASAAPAAPAVSVLSQGRGATVQANGFTYTVSPGQFDPKKSAMLVGGKTVNVERESICHIGDRSAAGSTPQPAVQVASPGTTVSAGNGMTYRVVKGSFDPRKTAMMVNGKTVNVERESICHTGDASATSSGPALGETVKAGNGMTYRVVSGTPDPRQTCMMVNGKTVAVEREAIGRIG